MTTIDLNKELLVIPFANQVLLHDYNTIIRVKSSIGEHIQQEMDQGVEYGIGVTLKQNMHHSKLGENDFYHTGTLIKFNYIKKLNEHYQVNVHVLERVEIKELHFKDMIRATYSLDPDIEDLDPKNEADMITYMKNIVKDSAKYMKGSEPYLEAISEIKSVVGLMGYLNQFLNVSIAEKQVLLETRSIKERGLKFLDYLVNQKESIKLQIEMAEKFSEKTNKSYREAFLREQMKAIQEELGESDAEGGKKKDYREMINASKMPEDVKKTALDEVNKLESLSPQSAEGNVVRSYLDLLVKLPWGHEDPQAIDIEKARQVLEADHYGLDKVKDRIIQHLAVMKLKKEKQGSILLLVGPPGTGKTSLGKSIAKALNRKYVRASLGGVRDEAEIRGHRRTYVGALPGRIIQGMKKAGETNPVFILDEVDKLMASYSGDPASALLEVLDPEQNNTFSDHYLEVPYDLSDVFFIATANSIRGIPAPLLDRMEMIQIAGYTNHEKFHIGKKHLLPEVLEEHGLDDTKLVMDDETMEDIIDKYTREAGVRNLKRQLTTTVRVASEKIVSGKVELPYKVHSDMLDDMLGREMIRHDVAEVDNPPGVVTGLAWTPVGGDILFIESTYMPGQGALTLTGQLGDVMKESAKISQSLIRSRLAYNTLNFDFSKHDMHVHVPSGSIPKDGPSAGVALFTAMASLVLGQKVDSKIAMTGEISLRGAVLPVGGIKEKVLAAHRAGIKKVILPKDNERDLKDVPQDIKDELTFVFAETIEDVIKETLHIDLPKSNALLGNPDADVNGLENK